MDQKTHGKGLEIRKAVPAGVDSFRIARGVFVELDKA